MNNYLFNYLITNQIKYALDFPTFKLSSFELGGNARIVAFPKEIQDFCNLLCFLRENNIRFYIVGSCTNTFFSDNGFDGVVVCTSLLNKSICENNIICAMCGASITDLSMLSMKNDLSGMEFCVGIPGSVGGAVLMNACAFGRAMSDVVLKTEVFDLNLRKRYFISKEEHLFRSKSSIFLKNTSLVILKTEFFLEKQEKTSVCSKMKEIALKRVSSQPLDKGNCGSAFKRPINGYASRMIDEIGLKGKRVGNVAISEKHAGFIVNLGAGMACEVLELSGLVKEHVFNNFGVALEEEFIFVE